jgi:hypothetical protein
LTRTGGYKVISKDSIEELKSGMEQIKQEVTLDKNN